MEQIIEDKTGTLTAAMNSSGNNKLSVAYTLKIRSGCEGGGKGALIQEDMSATLATNNDQYLFQPICMATQQGGAEIMEDKCPTITASAGMSGNNQPVVCYQDMVLDDQGGSQISVRDDGKCPTLRAEMHGNIPSVMEPIPIHDQATRFAGKHGDKADGKGNGLGVGNPGDPMNTLTAGDRHAVAYTMQAIGEYKDCGKASSLKMRDYKDATDLVCIPASFYPQMKAESQCFRQDNIANTLINGTNPGFQNAVVIAAPRVCVRYIVRRLTPTECARLQGFPDTWGHPDEKTELTDEEYQFWLNVRNTHAAINDKATKEYTKEQILKWYNGLHTDSSEYKMWGNGIALPNALYVMQGIADVMSEEKAARRKWLKDLLGGCL